MMPDCFIPPERREQVFVNSVVEKTEKSERKQVIKFHIGGHDNRDHRKDDIDEFINNIHINAQDDYTDDEFAMGPAHIWL